jgi:hypothetical protein
MPDRVLTLTCSKCTKQISVQGVDAEFIVEHLNKLGWVHQGGKTICPRCPARRK